MRGKDKERGKILNIDTNVEGASSTSSETVSQTNKGKELLGPPVDHDTVSKANRSVSPSTVDHESLLDAQRDSMLNTMEASVDAIMALALSTPLPAGSDPDSSIAGSPEETEHAPVTPRAVARSPPSASPIDPEADSNQTDKPRLNLAEQHSSIVGDAEFRPTPDVSLSGSLQATPLALISTELPAENPVAPTAPELAPIHVQLSTRETPETASGSLHLWLDSLGEKGEDGSSVATRKRRVVWVAVCCSTC
jgi:hypothetical protein